MMALPGAGGTTPTLPHLEAQRIGISSQKTLSAVIIERHSMDCRSALDVGTFR